MKVDLHIHSTASDGTLSPADIVNFASTKNLDIISLCDHDSVDGIKMAQKTAKSLGIKVVPSVELSTQHNGTSLHLLGYCLDYENKELREALRKLSKANTQRILTMVEKLQEKGYKISEQDLNQFSVGGLYRRPHLARALVAKGYAPSTKDAFKKLIGDDAPFFIPYTHFSAQEGIELIKKSGGVPFVAHPGLSGAIGDIGELAEMGAEGVEAFHPMQITETTNMIFEEAQKHDLLVSGGSDWHGSLDAGATFGDNMLPEPYLKEFLTAAPC